MRTRRQRALQRLDDVFVAVRVRIEDALIEGAIRAVVHAQHDRHDASACNATTSRSRRRSIGPPPPPVTLSPPQPEWTKETLIFGKRVTTYVFGEGRVEPLVGDAVSVEDDPVAALQRKVSPGRASTAQAATAASR